MKIVLFLGGILASLAGFRLMHAHFYLGEILALGGCFVSSVLFYNATAGRLLAGHADRIRQASEDRQARMGARNAEAARAAEGQSRARALAAATAQKPYRIPNPSIGFLNYLGAQGQALIEEDAAALGGLFPKNVRITNEKISKCDVLFIYCNLDHSGKIEGQPFTLRDVIRAAAALIVVVASEVGPETITSKEFTRAINARGAASANIVYTLNRNGDKFGLFFQRLFTQMRSGRPMALAWVQLAPQGPDTGQHGHLPGTILALEVGHVAFGQAYA